MIRIFLQMIYGDQINKLYTTHHNIPGSGNKVKKEVVRNSDHHIIIDPTGTNFDRYLVHDIIKKYAETQTIELASNPHSKFKTIQISNLDKLSHSAQTSLRRMIEVNAHQCRFIMWCDNLSNVIGPLKSRCICIRVPRPTKGELFAFLVYSAVCKKANPTMRTLVDIVDRVDCDIRKALWCLEAHVLGYTYDTSYDDAIRRIVGLILGCNIRKIEDIRDIFFNIWITNYEGIKIIKDIMKQLIGSDRLSEQSKLNIIIKTSDIEYNMMRGRRAIIHFDAFVAFVMGQIAGQTAVQTAVQTTL